jgi:hypothetical protein
MVRYMKIVVLIIASGESYTKQYAEMESVWLKYMNLFPDKFECYFIKSNPDLDAEIKVDKNTIWVRREENIIPGIITKTVLAIEYALSNTQFDYLVRTNMSSVINLPLLYNLLPIYEKKYPVHYFGSYNPHHGGYIEGSCIVLSRFACQYLCKHVNLSSTMLEDVTIGNTLYPHFTVTHYPKKDVLQYTHLSKLTPTDIDNYFHYRCKSHDHLETTQIMEAIVKTIFSV